MDETATGLEQEVCTDCGSIFLPEEGCTHDGRRLCRDHMHACRECLAALREDHQLDISA